MRRLPRIAAAAVVASLLLGAGAVGGVWWTRERAGQAPVVRPPEAPATAPVSSAPAAPAAPAEPLEITLTPDAVERAGIQVIPVISREVAVSLTVPASVGSNAYRDTKVVALVGGVAREVTAELGASVRRGQALAVIASPDLADAQTKYLSMRAMLRADHQRRDRTEKLVTLGAASRQELEEAVALHDTRVTEVEAARERLMVLGLSQDQLGRLEATSQVVAGLLVTAPADGVVIARAVNPGQVVAASQELFTVADLSTVWVIGDVFERDFPIVRPGTEAMVIVPAYGTTLRARVTYVDPRVDPQTRTARVRVEVPNPDRTLRLGMFASVILRGPGGVKVTVVPRGAIQQIGGRKVVYVQPDPAETRFVERSVQLGDESDGLVAVSNGLKPGERIVSEGSFFLRAEAARTRSVP